jgi:hypothetical protein
MLNPKCAIHTLGSSHVFGVISHLFGIRIKRYYMSLLCKLSVILFLTEMTRILVLYRIVNSNAKLV